MKQKIRGCLWSLFKMLIILVVICISFFLWAFKYPQKVTFDAYESVKVGQPLSDLVKEGAAFLRNRGEITWVTFEVPQEDGFGHKKSCAYIYFRDGKAVISIGDTSQKLGWEGPHEQLPNQLVKFKQELIKCSHLSAGYMPALFYRGTNKIEYNEDLVVTGKRDPVFWD